MMMMMMMLVGMMMMMMMMMVTMLVVVVVLVAMMMLVLVGMMILVVVAMTMVVVVVVGGVFLFLRSSRWIIYFVLREPYRFWVAIWLRMAGGAGKRMVRKRFIKPCQSNIEQSKHGLLKNGFFPAVRACHLFKIIVLTNLIFSPEMQYTPEIEYRYCN